MGGYVVAQLRSRSGGATVADVRVAPLLNSSSIWPSPWSRFQT